MGKKKTLVPRSLAGMHIGTTTVGNRMAVLPCPAEHHELATNAKGEPRLRGGQQRSSLFQRLGVDIRPFLPTASGYPRHQQKYDTVRPQMEQLLLT